MFHYLFTLDMETVALLMLAAVMAAVAVTIYIAAPRNERGARWPTITQGE